MATTTTIPSQTLDTITNFTLYYFNNSNGKTTVESLPSITVPSGSTFIYKFNLTNNLNIPMHLIGCNKLYSGTSGYGFLLQNSTPISGNITPKSTFPITLTMTAPTSGYNGSVAMVIGYYTGSPTIEANSKGAPPFVCGPPLPTGITSYGLYNNTDTTGYNVSTNEVVGYINLTGVSTIKASYPSVQQNLIIKVIDFGNSTKDYWLQNVFELSNSPVINLSAYFGTSFSNFSAINSNLSNTRINSSVINGSAGLVSPNFYVYGANGGINLKLPMQIGLYSKVDVKNHSGFVVYTGYKTNFKNNIIWYGRFFVNDSAIQNASFYVTSKAVTPHGGRYDAELVFAYWNLLGYTYYNSLNSSLGLFYYNKSTGSFQSFPSFYTYGSDTLENEFNVNVSLKNGYITAVSGGPYYGPLNRNFDTTFPSFLGGGQSSTTTVPTISTTTTIPISTTSIRSTSTSSIFTTSTTNPITKTSIPTSTVITTVAPTSSVVSTTISQQSSSNGIGGFVHEVITFFRNLFSRL